MTRRRDDRRLAVQFLYQADVSSRDPVVVMEERVTAGERVPSFTSELVSGVTERMRALDETIGAASEGWTVDRMAAVDRAVLRVAAFELLYREDVPDAVAIDEAVAAAKELSTAESGGFVNGILGRIARDRAEAG